MNKNKTAVIIHNKISKNAKTDELDVLDQVNLVKSALLQLNFNVEIEQISNNFIQEINFIKLKSPDFVFNLTETLADKSELLYFAPAVLASLSISYTGNSHEALFLTTSKILAKQIMKYNNIPTPEYILLTDTEKINQEKKYILKPVWEEGSVDLDEHSVFNGNNSEYISKISKLNKSHYFIEEYIEGREFNISVIYNENEPEVLSPAEMMFIDFPPEKPKILGYKAKWNENSFEYKNTVRSFETAKNEPYLLKNLKEISKKCWKIFKLKGYARVDFRVDIQGNPYVLEINANPCISPDSGFIAAIKQSGYTEMQAVERIISDLNF